MPLNLSGSTFLGGAGNDTINLSSVFTSTELVPTSGVVIDGGEGNDALVGTGNADTIIGGAGNDTITGGAGNDTITGGAGADVMTGGADSNRFVINNGDSGNLATGAVDLITDFRSTDVISGTGFLVAAVAQGAVAGYTTYALAAAAADLAGGNFIAAVGAVGGTSFTSYLFNGGTAGGGGTPLSAGLQLGATGSYTSTALAMSAVVAANIVA